MSTRAQAEQAVRVYVRDTCQWTNNDDGWWETQCGDAFVFETGGPKENGMKFCPYCGRRLEKNDGMV